MNSSLLTILLAITLILGIIWHYSHPTVKMSLIKGKAMNMKVFIIFLGIFTFISLVLDNLGEGDNIAAHAVVIAIALIIAVVGTIIQRLPESKPQQVSDHQAAKLPDKMTRTILREVMFCDMDLRGKIFEECDLKEADFRRADLENVQFIRCDIRGTNFTEANMTNVKMPGSVYNSQQAASIEEQEKEDIKARQILGWDNGDLEIGIIKNEW